MFLTNNAQWTQVIVATYSKISYFFIAPPKGAMWGGVAKYDKVVIGIFNHTEFHSLNKGG